MLQYSVKMVPWRLAVRDYGYVVSACNLANPYTYILGFQVQARLHCGTSKSSLCYIRYVPVAVPLNAHASIVQVAILHQS